MWLHAAQRFSASTTHRAAHRAKLRSSPRAAKDDVSSTRRFAPTRFDARWLFRLCFAALDEFRPAADVHVLSGLQARLGPLEFHYVGASITRTPLFADRTHHNPHAPCAGSVAWSCGAAMRH